MAREAIESDVPLPEGLSAEVLEQYETLTDTVTADLLARDNKVVAGALNELKSGNPYQVLEGFNDLAGAFEASLAANYPEALPSDDTVTPQVCGPTVCAAAIVAAVAAVTAIAAVNFNVAGNVNIIYNNNGLWTVNGVWISGSRTTQSANLPSSDPTQTVAAYPDLAKAEVAARVAETLH